VRIKLQDITVNSCIRLYQYNVRSDRSSSRQALRHLLFLIFGESTITVVNKYSAFRCKSGYKSKGGVQGQNSPFTPIQSMTRICALNGRKLILAKTMCHVPSSVYTCSSYYRRWIRTSLSSLQSHVLTSLWSNSYAIREDVWNGARFQTTSTSLVRNNQLPTFSCMLVAIHTFTHDVRRI